MANNLQVDIVANIADFQEKLRQAQDSLKESATEMQRWSDQVQASGGANTYAVGRLAEAKNAFAGYTLEVAEAKDGLAAAIPKVTEFAGSASVATRELLVLGREGARGNWTRMAGSLTILAQQGFGVAPAMLAGAAGVAALAGGLVYLIDRSEQAAIALDKIKLGASFEGGIDLSIQQIDRLATEIGKVPGAIDVDGRKVVAAFATMRNTSAPEIEALGLLVKNFAAATDQDSEKATEALKKVFNDPLKNAVQFVAEMHGATEAQREQAQAAVEGGDAHAAAAVMVEALRQALASQATTQNDLAVKQLTAIRNIFDLNLGTLQLEARMRAIKERITETAAATEILNESDQRQLGLLRDLEGAMQGMASAPAAAMLAGVSDAAKLDPTLNRVDELNAKVKEFTALLPTATVEAQRLGDSRPLDQLTAGLSKAQEELSSLKFGPMLDNARASIAQLQSTWSGSQAGMETAERAIWAKVAQATAVGTKEHLQAIQEMGRLDVELRRQAATAAGAAGRDLIATTKEQIQDEAADRSLSRTEELNLARQTWATLLNGTQLSHADWLAAEREFNSARRQLETEAAQQAQQIAQSHSSTDIAIRHQQLEAEQQELQAGVVYQQMTADQKVAIMRGLIQRLAALDIEELQNEQKAYAQGSVEYEKLADQIRLTRAKLNTDLAKYDAEQAANFKKSVDDQARVWQQGLSEIDGLEQNFITDLFSNRLGLTKSLQALTARFIQEELAADLKYWTMRGLYSSLGMTEDAKKLQGGVIVALLTESQKTGVTAQGTAQRAAIDGAGQTSFLGRVGRQLAEWLGLETQKTAETATETAARTGIDATASATQTAEQVAAAAAQHAARVAANVATLTADASLVFGGVFANLSPVLGPAAAGPAAAAQAAVLAQIPIASLDVGAWDVPRDMLAFIHEGERVVPKSFAQGYGEAIGGGAGGQGPINLSASFPITSMDARGVIAALKDKRVIRSFARDLARELGDNMTSRPSYGS